MGLVFGSAISYSCHLCGYHGAFPLLLSVICVSFTMSLREACNCWGRQFRFLPSRILSFFSTSAVMLHLSTFLRFMSVFCFSSLKVAR